MKLSAKIRLFSSLFMLVLILLVNTSIYFLFKNISINSEVDEMTSQTNEIVKTLNSNPEIARSDLLRAYLPTDGMIRVVEEENDRLLLTLTKKDSFTELPASFVKTESNSIIHLDNQANFVTISKPIIWENGEIVTLQVYKQLVAHTETMQTLFYVLIVASAIMLIPTIIAGVFLSRFILNPIKALTAAMKENITNTKWKKIYVENRSRDELYEMENTFNTMIEYLKDNFEKQETFVSDASHELKTPISIVKSYAELLERRGQGNPELFNESIQAIESEADRMQKLVEQMLLLARNQEKDAHEQINIVDICRETVAKFKGAYNREIIIETEKDVLYVNGSQDQLQQVIYILIDNALKYSDGIVKLTIRRENTNVIVNVQDSGQGIPNEEQEKIFDRFYRMEKSRNRDLGGTGLGLSIAKTIVAAHDGSLRVTSKAGEGSTFTIEFPIVKES
ncbi:HAMP domain-containing sensor histidine kinase [Virgibacillus litoralis]|uniref:Signal transduction histidine-protein kinase ArlS n=1 Tax=Virgibacillus litoralis TaxID=578221 RepID=A0ABS4HIB6_9BACI|nr:HAMP domain-containing histidine kinase [Virgibacillus litoralis]MBP1950670.1 signal transduction histidine kinase [Virgibacillus litoralis]